MGTIDTSIYDDARKDVEDILKSYPSLLVHEATLYIVDKQAIDKLKDIERLLVMEYSQYSAEHEASTLKKKGRPPVEKYSLASIVKVINFDEACNAYQTYISESWKQVNNREKVKSRIDAEFDKHKNKLRKFTKKKLEEKGVSKDIQAEIERSIEKELKEAEKERDYILANFDKLDVRISTYFERVKYAGLSWFIKGEKQMNVNLRKEVPNVLWFEELENRVRKDNKLVKFLSEAKRAYGDVFYRPFTEEELRELKEKEELENGER